MSYYKHHVFFCLNQRDPPEKCCNNAGATEMQAYAKARIKALGLSGKGRIRINKSGCLDRCEEGPILVVYPDEVWYTYRGPLRHRRDHRPASRERRDRAAAAHLNPATLERYTDRGPAARARSRAQPAAHAARGHRVDRHPNPVEGGTLDNKVVHTLAKTLFGLSYVAVRFNYRGVGASEGTFDEGAGETDDALAALAQRARGSALACPSCSRASRSAPSSHRRSRRSSSRNASCWSAPLSAASP